MKILFVISNLIDGGAERVLSLLANEFVSRKHNIVIVTRSSVCTYELHSDIRHEILFEDDDKSTGVSRKIKFISRLTNKIKKEQPDIVISFMKGMNGKVITISKFLGLPVIASEHTNYHRRMNLFSWIESRWIYKMADAVAVLTKYDYEEFYKFFLTNAVVIPNPVTFESIKKLGIRDKTIFAAGSLNRLSFKGFDNLLLIFSKVMKVHPDWKLIIAGSGEEGKKYLMDMANDLKIQDSVEFPGFYKNIAAMMQRFPIYVSTSRVEGFPMVLIEAMSQGCACISFDCVSGPGEIIQNNVDGILVEDQNMELMEKEICRLIEDEKLRESLAINATKNVQRFSIEKIGDAWMDLIASVVKK